MHILIIPSWYPVKDNPIRGIFFKEQARALVKRGYKVTVAFPEIWSIKTYGKHKESKGLYISDEDGIKTYRFKRYNYFPRFPHVQALLNYTSLKKLYLTIVNNEGIPDIIHAHSALWAGWAAAKISKEEGVPFLMTEHSSAFDRQMIQPYQKKYIYNTFNTSKQVIVVGPSLKNHVKKYVDENKIKLIPNIVDITEFKLVKKKPIEKFRFLSIGFLSKNKGMDILLKSFARAFNSSDNVELVIGGNGAELDDLQRMAMELGVSDKVHFLGRLSREQVKKQMQECNVFVLASRFETFGVVYIEAMACGKPVIATKCGGPEMIVNESNGILVEKEDIEELQHALQLMFKNHNTYNPITIRQECEQKYSEKVVVSQLEKVYEEILI